MYEKTGQAVWVWATAVQFYSNNILSFPNRHLLPPATCSKRAWTSGVEIYISFSCSGKSNEISLNAIYLFISGTSLDPRGNRREYNCPGSCLHGAHRGLALCRGCPGGDSGTACVWAEDPRTRFWEKRPSSVKGARQNFTFHSGKWGRILGI